MPNWTVQIGPSPPRRKSSLQKLHLTIDGGKGESKRRFLHLRKGFGSPRQTPKGEEFDPMEGSGGPQGTRCRHCAGPLSKDMETSSWTVSPFIRDSFSMIGTAVGGTASAFYGFNHAMPIVRRWVKGPMWFHFLVGAPPVIVFSSACAGLAGGAIPALAQLASSSYHAAIASSSLEPSSSRDDIMQKSRSSSSV